MKRRGGDIRDLPRCFPWRRARSDPDLVRSMSRTCSFSATLAEIATRRAWDWYAGVEPLSQKRTFLGGPVTDASPPDPGVNQTPTLWDKTRATVERGTFLAWAMSRTTVPAFLSARMLTT